MSQSIGIVGAGAMGTGIAMDLLLHGYNVVLKDINTESLKRSERQLRNDFRGLKMMKKEMKVDSFDQLIQNLHLTTDYDRFNAVDFVIENVPEQLAVKRNVYQELSSTCSAETIYMVNTSCIPITEIASILSRPEKVVGTHFMNPVPLKNLVEMIRGVYTSDETVEKVTTFLKTLSKKAVIVGDYAGFVTNRLSHLFMNEAAFLVMENVASPKDIDTIFREGYGHAMGPLETADLIGIDTVVDSLYVLYDYYQDPKFKCCPLLKRMKQANQTGRKSGKGFYQY